MRTPNTNIDDGQATNSNRSFTNNDPAHDKKKTPKDKKITYTYKLDSPRTMQALRELGLKPDDIKIKYTYLIPSSNDIRTKEDFKNEGIAEDLLQWREDHYMSRVNSITIHI